MTAWRPLSRRDDPTYDEPLEGLPDHLFQPIWSWVESVLGAGRVSVVALLEVVQARLQLIPPLDWSAGKYSAERSLRARMFDDREVALDVLDLLVALDVSNGRETSLDAKLRTGGSIWGVGVGKDGVNNLQQRAPGPVAEGMDAIRSDDERAHHHLRAAWGALMGRGPDPSTAYRESIRAVEVAAKRVVSPNNTNATLGTMIASIRAKPTDWCVGLPQGHLGANCRDGRTHLEGAARPPRHRRSRGPPQRVPGRGR